MVTSLKNSAGFSAVMKPGLTPNDFSKAAGQASHAIGEGVVAFRLDDHVNVIQKD